ncbi:MAG: T9SS type A sorting domain-containing protein [Bacteroidota bacterium]
MNSIKNVLIQIILINLILISFIYAQTDTVIVPDNYDGDYYGAINKFIKENPGHGYYKLEVGKYYLLNAPIEPDSNLNTFRLIADKPDPIDPTKFPPVVVMGDIPSDRLLRYFILDEDAHFENIYFLGAHPTLNLDINVVLELKKTGGKYSFDGCYFQWSEWIGIDVEADDMSLTVKNCLIKNYSNATSMWNSRFIQVRSDHLDTLIMTNNTYFNSNHRFVHGLAYDHYVFEHNTIVNTMKSPPINATYLVNAKISNNLFYNAYCYGNSAQDLAPFEDGLPAGLINVKRLLEEHNDSGYTAANRKIKIKNNSWYHTQVIKDYWDSFSIIGDSIFNDSTRYIIDSDTEWPGIVEENTRYMDPGFKKVEGEVELVDWMTKNRNYEGRTWWPLPLDPDRNRFTITWPLVVDFSYTNDTLIIGGEGGFPVGDLNWWGADKVAEWEAWYPTGIESKSNKTIPIEYLLEQNYPNPFNPSTVIKYSIPNTMNVKVTVHNTLGQKVAELVNGKMQAGKHQITFNASNLVSGVYFYSINAGDFHKTKKMLLLR